MIVKGTLSLRDFTMADPWPSLRVKEASEEPDSLTTKRLPAPQIILLRW